MDKVAVALDQIVLEDKISPTINWGCWQYTLVVLTLGGLLVTLVATKECTICCNNTQAPITAYFNKTFKNVTITTPVSGEKCPGSGIVTVTPL